jgi:hypothetical protein
VAVSKTATIPQKRLFLIMVMRLHDPVVHSRNILGIFGRPDGASVIDKRADLAVSFGTHE